MLRLVTIAQPFEFNWVSKQSRHVINGGLLKYFLVHNTPKLFLNKQPLSMVIKRYMPSGKGGIVVVLTEAVCAAQTAPGVVIPGVMKAGISSVVIPTKYVPFKREMPVVAYPRADPTYFTPPAPSTAAVIRRKILMENDGPFPIAFKAGSGLSDKPVGKVQSMVQEGAVPESSGAVPNLELSKAVSSGLRQPYANSVIKGGLESAGITNKPLNIAAFVPLERVGHVDVSNRGTLLGAMPGGAPIKTTVHSISAPGGDEAPATFTASFCEAVKVEDSRESSNEIMMFFQQHGFTSLSPAQMLKLKIRFLEDVIIDYRRINITAQRSIDCNLVPVDSIVIKIQEIARRQARIESVAKDREKLLQTAAELDTSFGSDNIPVLKSKNRLEKLKEVRDELVMYESALDSKAVEYTIKAIKHLWPALPSGVYLRYKDSPELFLDDLAKILEQMPPFGAGPV